MAQINYITQVQIDFGVLALLPQECARAGMKKPLLVTDVGVRAAGLPCRVTPAVRPSPSRRPDMAATHALPPAPPVQRPRVLLVGAAFAAAAAVALWMAAAGDWATCSAA